MRPRKRTQIWVHPSLAKEIKIESAETGKKMQEVSKDLAELLKNKRSKKSRDYGFL